MYTTLMDYSFDTFKKEITEVEDWLKKELSSIHTGRATPSLLDGISIDSYGAKTSVAHVAAITTEDARTLRIAPWDKSHIQEIEKAVNNANLGVSVSSDEMGLRVFFPELTTERRASLVKIVKERLENAKISLRKHREKTWEDIQEKEKKSELTEDDKFRLKDELQKLVDEANNLLGENAERKEKEVMS